MMDLDRADPNHRELSTAELFREGPWRVGLLVLVLAGAGLLAFSSSAAADHGDAAIVVAPDGSEDFTAIQPAIAHADAGDTIRVLPGTYEETVTIDEPDLRLCSSTDGTACDGTPEDTIIHGLAEFSPVVSIEADGASLQGFFVNVAGEGIAIDASEPSRTLVEGNEVETGIPEATFGVQAATNPADRDYWLSPFVEEMYTDGVVAEVAAEYEHTEGFVTAIPAVPDDGENHIVLVYEDEAPDSVTDEPATDDRPALRVYEGVDYEEPRADPATAGPDEADTVWQAPEAPEQVPDGYEKIRPGARLSVGCTANWIWSDASGRLYLGTAGHCFLSGGEETNFDSSVSVCVENCSRYGFGVEVQPRTWLELGQVRYAENTGQIDFAAIEIPVGLYDEWVDPELAHWGGPTDAIANRSKPEAGTPYAHYGHGQGVAETFLTQPRAGTFAVSNDHQVQFFPPPSFGDSGSPIATGDATVEDDYHGERAAGIVTHIGLINPWGVPNTGLGGGPHVDHIKDTVEAELDFASFDVVLEDEAIEVPGAWDTTPGSTPSVTEGTPAVTPDASGSSHPGDPPITSPWTLPTVGSGSTDGAQPERLASDDGASSATVTVEGHLGETDETVLTRTRPRSLPR